MTEKPKLVIIDIGPASAGLIHLLKNELTDNNLNVISINEVEQQTIKKPPHSLEDNNFLIELKDKDINKPLNKNGRHYPDGAYYHKFKK